MKFQPNCQHVNVTRPHWFYIDIDSGNGNARQQANTWTNFVKVPWHMASQDHSEFSEDSSWLPMIQQPVILDLFNTSCPHPYPHPHPTPTTSLIIINYAQCPLLDWHKNLILVSFIGE